MACVDLCLINILILPNPKADNTDTQIICIPICQVNLGDSTVAFYSSVFLAPD